jgi:hypothetical protein
VEVTFNNPSNVPELSPKGWKKDKNTKTKTATNAANQVIFLIEFNGYGSLSNWTTHM